MADPNSLYHEVKKLIGIRQETKVLQSEAQVEFVYCEENAYPLAYRRFQEEESVLIVVNPSGKDASFAYDGKLGDVIYQNGKDFTLEDGVFTIPGATAVFVKEER